jgi:hypothetical protein
LHANKCEVAASRVSVCTLYPVQERSDLPVILAYNFSKELCTLPDDDLRIETCRSILSVLLRILD